MLRKSMLIDPGDNVAVLLEPAAAGDCIHINGQDLVLLEDIAFAHKAALRDMKENDKVIKYGEEIGYMRRDISAGSWIHNHNMGCDRGRRR